MRLVAQLATLVVMPLVLVGVVTRVKSLWSGRRGAPVLQPVFDVVRLFRKKPVVSHVSTPMFQAGPAVFLVTALVTALLAPSLGAPPLFSFGYDFVWLAYAWGLGRVALMLSALDTGSAFEGMGAAREAVFSSMLEPVLFLVVGGLSLAAGVHSLSEAVALPVHGGLGLLAWAGALVALVVVLTVETGRMPVDDPTTHLELTMVHEVMVLDHAGPELGMVQLGAALKLFTTASFLAALLNPFAAEAGLKGPLVNVGLLLGVAVAIGTVESLMARLKLRAVPRYIGLGLGSALVVALLGAWTHRGGA